MPPDHAPTPQRRPAHGHHTPAAPTLPAVPELLLALDPAAAIAADLDALPPSPTSPASDLRADAGLWLALANTVATLARLAPRHRAAHLRHTHPLWSDAAAHWHSPRYAALGDRLARWRRHDPTLTLVRELLWAAEALERAGGVRLAYTTLVLLTELVPPGSRRAGHILAQSGRPLLTLGAADAALARYAAALRIGQAHRDPWLRARSALGAGSVHTLRGHPSAARQAFAYAVRTVPANSPLARAARHGLALCTPAGHHPAVARAADQHPPDRSAGHPHLRRTLGERPRHWPERTAPADSSPAAPPFAPAPPPRVRRSAPPRPSTSQPVPPGTLTSHAPRSTHRLPDARQRTTDCPDVRHVFTLTRSPDHRPSRPRSSHAVHPSWPLSRC